MFVSCIIWCAGKNEILAQAQVNISVAVASFTLRECAAWKLIFITFYFELAKLSHMALLKCFCIGRSLSFFFEFAKSKEMV